MVDDGDGTTRSADWPSHLSAVSADEFESVNFDELWPTADDDEDSQPDGLSATGRRSRSDLS